MPSRDEILPILDHLESYLTSSLLPFWLKNSPDPEYGGFFQHSPLRLWGWALRRVGRDGGALHRQPLLGRPK
jgi:mannose/cellobiose epimerase-like protein (N-acyl-D-glucosamine 2-epimerase family)